MKHSLCNKLALSKKNRERETVSAIVVLNLHDPLNPTFLEVVLPNNSSHSG